MTFLSSIVGYVITALISALGGFLLKMLHSWQQDRAAKAADEQKTADAVKALQDAKTKQELEDAAKQIAGNV